MLNAGLQIKSDTLNIYRNNRIICSPAQNLLQRHRFIFRTVKYQLYSCSQNPIFRKPLFFNGSFLNVYICATNIKLLTAPFTTGLAAFTAMIFDFFLSTYEITSVWKPSIKDHVILKPHLTSLTMQVLIMMMTVIPSTCRTLTPHSTAFAKMPLI